MDVSNTHLIQHVCLHGISRQHYSILNLGCSFSSQPLFSQCDVFPTLVMEPEGQGWLYGTETSCTESTHHLSHGYVHTVYTPPVTWLCTHNLHTTCHMAMYIESTHHLSHGYVHTVYTPPVTGLCTHSLHTTCHMAMYTQSTHHLSHGYVHTVYTPPVTWLCT